MAEPLVLLILTVTATFALAITAFAALHVWRGWLELKRARMGHPRPQSGELSELKRRIRRLEAIADGEG